MLAIVGLVVGVAIGFFLHGIIEWNERRKGIQRCNHCGRVNQVCMECAHGFICENCKSVGKV